MSGGMILHPLISVIFELDASKKLKLGSFTGVWDGVLGFLLLVVCVLSFLLNIEIYIQQLVCPQKKERMLPIDLKGKV